MSSHWKLEVHLTTPGETDEEADKIQKFAEKLSELTAAWVAESGGAIRNVYVSEAERT